jgi:hypothetical protein
MKKYKISVSGKGSEIFVFPINEGQIQRLKEIDVEKSDIDFDEVGEILNVESISDTDISYIGAYSDPELFHIEVENGNGAVIWESDTQFYPEDNVEEYLYDDEDVLLVEDYQKGTFFTYELELEEEFNFALLNLITKEIAERVEIVVGLTYNGNDIENFKDFGDTWSKGISYYICKK